MVDTEEPAVVDFAWFFVVGKTRLNLSSEEVGRMTVRLFMRLFSRYKQMFDYELCLKRSNTTYEEAEKRAYQSEMWF